MDLKTEPMMIVMITITIIISINEKPFSARVQSSGGRLLLVRGIGSVSSHVSSHGYGQGKGKARRRTGEGACAHRDQVCAICADALNVPANVIRNRQIVIALHVVHEVIGACSALGLGKIN